jgi:hypothetical protein
MIEAAAERTHDVAIRAAVGVDGTVMSVSATDPREPRRGLDARARQLGQRRRVFRLRRAEAEPITQERDGAPKLLI